MKIPFAFSGLLFVVAGLLFLSLIHISIVRHIAQVMKGSGIRKSQEDVGTEITVLLPFHQEPAGAGSQNGSAGADGPAGAGGHAGSAGADGHNGR